MTAITSGHPTKLSSITPKTWFGATLWHNIKSTDKTKISQPISVVNTIETIKNFRANTDTRPNNNVAANVLKLKFKAMYTYLFNLINQYFK